MDNEEAIELIKDVRAMIFQDYDVWSGYTKNDFNKLIKLLEEN